MVIREIIIIAIRIPFIKLKYYNFSKYISQKNKKGKENFNPDKSGQRSQRYAEFIKKLFPKSVCLKRVSSFGLDTHVCYTFYNSLRPLPAP